MAHDPDSTWLSPAINLVNKELSDIEHQLNDLIIDGKGVVKDIFLALEYSAIEMDIAKRKR